MDARALTPRQEAFVLQYLVDLNATQAAIRAGYSKRSAPAIGVALLGKTHVREAVETARARRAEQVERTALDVLRDIQELTRTARDAGQYKVALRGLELEGKHLGMFTEKLDMSMNVHLSTAIEEARNRVRHR